MRFTHEIPEKTANKRLAHHRAVRSTVVFNLVQISARASANLASHYQEGAHEIDWEFAGVDGFVKMTGPAALSVELGHHARDGSWVEGTRILRDALGGG